MSPRWQTARVFISSTFRDMHAERDYLIKVVFPALRERLLPHRIELIDIDLRWGITEEEARNDRVLDLCLELIDGCRPFFLGILGERYGWVPRTLSDVVQEKHGWVQRETGKSVTELEMLFGVLLMDPRMKGRSFFYFRDPRALEAIPEPIRSEVYAETDPDLIAKLAALKQNIRVMIAQGYPVFENYPAHWNQALINRAAADEKYKQGRLEGLEAFGLRVKRDLWRGLCRQYPQIRHRRRLLLERTQPTPAPADPWAEEEDIQERFIHSRLRVYVGRKNVRNDLARYADGDHMIPCLVTGASGSGKSAALARFVRVYKRARRDTLLMSHFVGASPRSTNLRDMLRRFCQVLKARFGFVEEVPEETVKLAVTFREFLGKIPADKRVLLVIDALNQLDEADRARELWWLPRELRPHVKVLASSIIDPESAESENEPVARCFHHRPYHGLRIADLSDLDRRRIIRAVPSLSAKTLDDVQVDLLLTNPATSNPLFLLVTLEELRGFGAFEQLDRRIVGLPHPLGQEALWHKWLNSAKETTRSVADKKNREDQLERLVRIESELNTVEPVDDTLRDVFMQVIERLGTEFDPEVVRKILSLVAASRRGLSERELLDIVEGPGVKTESSRGDLFPVLRQLRPYLVSRGGLLGFFHLQLRAAVYFAYFNMPTHQAPTTEPLRSTHARLAVYFRGIADEAEAPLPWSELRPRGLAELSYHLTLAERWRELEETLCDLRFVEAACSAALSYQLIDDYDRALSHMYGPHGRSGYEARAKISEFSIFYKYHCKMFAICPSIVLPFGHNYADSGAVVASADRCLKDRPWSENPWVELQDRPPRLERPALQYTLEGHQGEVTSVALSEDGLLAVSGGSDGALRVWDIEHGFCLQTLVVHEQGVNAVAVSRDGLVAVTGGADGSLAAWSVEDGQCLSRVVADEREVLAVALDAKGRLAASGGSEGIIRLWDVATGRLLAEFLGHFGPVSALAISPGGKTLASGSWDCMVRVWDVSEARCTTCLEGHSVPVQGLALSADGRLAASCSGMQADVDGRVSSRLYSASEVRFWSTSGWCRAVARCHDIGNRGGRVEGVLASVIHGVALDLSGTTAASVGYDRTLCVYNARSGELLNRFHGHNDCVRGVALAAAGDRAVTCGCDGSVRVWDLGGRSEPSSERTRHVGRIGRGRAVTPSDRGRLFWRNLRVRRFVLYPVLSLAIVPVAVAWSTRSAGGSSDLWTSVSSALFVYALLYFIEFRAVLKADGQTWHNSPLPRAFWYVVGLAVWPLSHSFPVLWCPSCGHALCGRSGWFRCSHCGFHDRFLVSRRRQPEGRS